MQRIRLIVAALLVTPFAATADIIEYNMSWTGNDGYTVEGMFSFDDALVGAQADESELISLMLTAFEPDGDALKTYDLTNQDNSYFNFHFDLATQSILQSGFTTSDTGFVFGAFAATDDYFFGGGITGCAQSGNPGIVLSIQGGCQSQVLDFGGSILTVTPKNSVPEPGTLALFGIGLFGMAASRRRKKV